MKCLDQISTLACLRGFVFIDVGYKRPQPTVGGTIPMQEFLACMKTHQHRSELGSAPVSSIPSQLQNNQNPNQPITCFLIHSSELALLETRSIRAILTFRTEALTLKFLPNVSTLLQRIILARNLGEMRVLVLFQFQYGILLHCSAWPGTHNAPVSAFQVLRLQLCITKPSYKLGLN